MTGWDRDSTVGVVGTSWYNIWAFCNSAVNKDPLMTEDQGQKDDGKFDFTREGEALAYISLDQARVLAMRTARETPGAYGSTYADILMAFDVVEAEETEDHYIITLSFRPQGEFDGRAGREQFFIEKEGNVAHRQVLSLPRRRGRFPLIPVAIVLVVVAAVVVGAMLVVFEMGGRGDGEEPASVAVLPTDTPVPPTVTPVPAPTEALTVGAAPAASTATATPVLTPSQAPTSAPAAAPIQAPASVLVATPTYNPQPTATRAPTATVTPRLMPTATNYADA